MFCADFADGLLADVHNLIKIDTDELETVENIKDVESLEIEGTCPDCKTKMNMYKYTYICDSCGLETDINYCSDEFSESVKNNYNSNSSGQSVRICGINSYANNKALFSAFNEDYRILQYQRTIDDLNYCNVQSTVFTLPDLIITAVADLYREIQDSKHTLRSKSRLGTLGACIWHICNTNNIPKKTKEVAKFINVDETAISRGDKLIWKLVALKIIDLDVSYNTFDSFKKQYFTLLGLDEKYLDMPNDILDIIDNEPSIIGVNNSRPDTKCVGVIYAIILQCGLAISKSQIATACNISIQAFVTYQKHMFVNRAILRPIFKKYHVPRMHREHLVPRPVSPRPVNIDDSKVVSGNSVLPASSVPSVNRPRARRSTGPPKPPVTTPRPQVPRPVTR